MNAITAELPIPPEPAAPPRMRWELAGIALATIMCNLGLLAGMRSETLAFLPSEAMSGSWWQWFTWPLVHVSGYHLMMDLTGFLSVFVLLGAMSVRRRWALVAASVAGSVALPLLLSSTLHTHGLAGLSGPAHGLMAAAALSYTLDARRQNDRTTFWIFGGLFAGVLLKVTWEVATGTIILSPAHFGNVGTPIVSTHLGGVIGALLAYGLSIPCKRRTVLRAVFSVGLILLPMSLENGPGGPFYGIG